MIMTRGRVSVALTGIPETMLWTLHNRAAEARRSDAKLHDPLAVRIADAIDYDFVKSFGKPDSSHALRSIVIDAVLRDWLGRHPGGLVVALGEGLETQFHRVDDGRVRWLSVDLPEAIEVRQRFLPDTDRHRNLACSALDTRWMGEAGNGPVFVTAAGLLMYLQPEEVRGLIASIAARFPTAELAFDVIPPWFVRKSLEGYKKTAHYVAPPMPWGLNRDELASMKAWHPNIAEVRELPIPAGRGLMFGALIPLIRRLPRLGNKSWSIVHLICRAAREPG
jgi:O-methyltransferase involved in polyketide biosynthesis